MLYKFKSKATGDVIMTAVHGDHLLKAWGRQPAAKGILLVQDMAGALASMQAAWEAEEARLAAAADQARQEGREPVRSKEIALRQRWWPMVEMIGRAQKAEEDIVWGV
jgi:hypothetical protein